METEYPTATLTFLEDNVIYTYHPETNEGTIRQVRKNEEEKNAIVISHIGSLVKVILYPKVKVTRSGNNTKCNIIVGNYFEFNLLDRQPQEPKGLLFKLVYDPNPS